jgi:hypothetical protein
LVDPSWPKLPRTLAPDGRLCAVLAQQARLRARVPDPPLQHLVGLQKLVDLRLRDARASAEVEIEAPLTIGSDHRLQNQAPVPDADPCDAIGRQRWIAR